MCRLCYERGRSSGPGPRRHQSSTVVEVLVSVGAQVAVDDPLITLESEKASMDIPSTAAGTVASIAVKKGQEVSSGTVIAIVTSAKSEAAPEKAAAPAPRRRPPLAQARAAGGRNARSAGCRRRRMPKQRRPRSPRKGHPQRRPLRRRARSRGPRLGSRRLYGGLPRRRLGAQGHAHRTLADARRGVPQRGLHSVKGALARSESDRGCGRHVRRGHRVRAAGDRSRTLACLEESRS